MHLILCYLQNTLKAMHRKWLVRGDCSPCVKGSNDQDGFERSISLCFGTQKWMALNRAEVSCCLPHLSLQAGEPHQHQLIWMSLLWESSTATPRQRGTAAASQAQRMFVPSSPQCTQRALNNTGIYSAPICAESRQSLLWQIPLRTANVAYSPVRQLR